MLKCIANNVMYSTGFAISREALTYIAHFLTFVTPLSTNMNVRCNTLTIVLWVFENPQFIT